MERDNVQNVRVVKCTKRNGTTTTRGSDGTRMSVSIDINLESGWGTTQHHMCRASGKGVLVFVVGKI